MQSASRKTVAIVDDDAAFASILDGYLQTAKFRTLRLGTGSELFALLASRPPDVIILDLTLPDEDGLAITRRVRARSSVPIIIVTGRQNSDDRLAGLEMGADDYLTKPFNPRELVIRVRRLLERSARSKTPPADRYQLGDWIIDPERRTIERRGKGAELTRMEYDVLQVLLRAHGRVQTRAQLLDATTRRDGPESERSIDILISRLRRKLEPSKGKPTLLLTVAGHGYRINDAALSVVRRPEGYDRDFT